MQNTILSQIHKTQQILQFTAQLSLIFVACVLTQLACAVYFYELGGSIFLPYLGLFGMLFCLSTAFATKGRVNAARSLFILSFIGYIACVSVLWGESLHVQYVMLSGLLAGGYLYQQHETKLRWLTNGLLIVSFLVLEGYLFTGLVETQQKSFLLNSVIIGVVALGVFIVRTHADLSMKTLKASHDEHYNLLKGLFPSLPDNTGTLWKPGEIHRIENVSVLFSDLQGYTLLSQRFSDEEVVSILDALYTEFDKIAVKYGIEKIKTNGDEYMAAKGIPSVFSQHSDSRENNALAMCNFAIEIQQTFYDLCDKLSVPCNIRVGVATGSVAAGIIGTHKPTFDIWGDTVNKASRLEKYGFTDSVHMCNQTTLLVKEAFNKLDNYKMQQSTAHQVGSCFRLVNTALTNKTENQTFS